MSRFAIRNQVSQQIENLGFIQNVEHAWRHVRDFGHGALVDFRFADGDHFFVRDQSSDRNLAFIFALNPASDNFAGRGFDLGQDITFSDAF